MLDEEEQSLPKRIFINDVDRYSSKHIAKLLSTFNAEESSFEEEDTDESTARGEPFQIVGTVSPSTKDEKENFMFEQYTIVGTVFPSTKDDKENFMYEQYTSPPREELLEHLLECDVVVYNISENTTKQQVEEATWAIEALHADMENFKSQKMFILVSSVMTWAMTKPQNPEDIDVLLTEEEFMRRKPHPSFRDHYVLEKLVIKLGRSKKSNLTAYVVASGLQYGKGENLFHYFFKVSWLKQFPKVPLFGSGTNYIPMIHVYDLGRVIQNIIELKPKSKYILAVDDSKNSLEEIVKTISDTLGPGKINKVPEQEAIAMDAFKPEELDHLNINLRMDAFVIKDSFSLSWTSETGMVENMASIVEEYKDTRQLLPIRICLVGPPAVGKTTIAEKLCSHYQLHHINIKEVIEEEIAQLKEKLNQTDPEYFNEEVAAAAQKQLEHLTKNMENNAGRLGDHMVLDILQEKLNSKPCMNQGFVLDGYPKTYEQAQLIFSDDDPENQDLMLRSPSYNNNITPEHVFALDATDDFLTQRVQGLPQSEAETKRYTQEEFISRLTGYRERSAAEETLLNYFDELEIHPEHIDVTTDDPEYTDVMKKITEMIGVPKNYGLSPEELEEEERKREEERKQKVLAEAAEKKRRNEAALAQLAAQYEEWRKNLSEVKRQEYELLEAHSLPLRNYLMKYVMPSLSEAMLDCSKLKPDDPVDFLAEHLLRNNSVR